MDFWVALELLYKKGFFGENLAPDTPWDPPALVFTPNRELRKINAYAQLKRVENRQNGQKRLKMVS